MRLTRMAVPLAALALASCEAQADSAASDTGAPVYAVLIERGTSNLLMKPGSNVRHLSASAVSDPASIAFDSASGLLTLRRGLYRLSGYSITTFGFDLTPAQDSAMYSAPGYAYLCNVETGGIQTLGSMQDPLTSITSSVDDIVAVPDSMVLYLGHQNGDRVDGVYATTFVEGLGTDHLFAQLTVERLGDSPAGAAPPPPAGTHPCWPL